MVEFPLATDPSRNLQVVILAKSGREAAHAAQAGLHCTCAELATLQSGKQLRAEQGRGAAGEQGGGRIVG